MSSFLTFNTCKAKDPKTTGPGICTLSPDEILWFNFWEACLVHNYFYRGRKVPGYDVDTRWKSDWVFWKKLNRIVIRDSKFFLHMLAGFLLAFIFFIVVRMVSWKFYKPGDNNGRD